MICDSPMPTELDFLMISPQNKKGQSHTHIHVHIFYQMSIQIKSYYMLLQSFNETIQFQEQTVDKEGAGQELHLQLVCLQTISQLFCGVGLSHAQHC